MLSDDWIMVWKWAFEWDESVGEGVNKLASKWEIVGDRDAGAASLVMLAEWIVMLFLLGMLASVVQSSALKREELV